MIESVKHLQHEQLKLLISLPFHDRSRVPVTGRGSESNVLIEAGSRSQAGSRIEAGGFYPKFYRKYRKRVSDDNYIYIHTLIQHQLSLTVTGSSSSFIHHDNNNPFSVLRANNYRPILSHYLPHAKLLRPFTAVNLYRI
jgi:hypothetical protein